MCNESAIDAQKKTSLGVLQCVTRVRYRWGKV